MSQQQLVNEILEERVRQDMKWGIQNHSPMEWIVILAEEFGEASKEALEEHFGELSDSSGYQKYKKEVIQVAAVALAMLESLERNL